MVKENSYFLKVRNHVSSKRISLYKEFKACPEKALEYMFENDPIPYYKNKCVFIWTCCRDENGVGYGSFKYVFKDNLENRKYKVGWYDYKPGIEYHDAYYDLEKKCVVMK